MCFGGVRGCYVRATGVDRLQLLLLGGEGRLEQQISRLQREDVVVGVHAFDQLQGRGGHVFGGAGPDVPHADVVVVAGNRRGGKLRRLKVKGEGVEAGHGAVVVVVVVVPQSVLLGFRRRRLHCRQQVSLPVDLGLVRPVVGLFQS